METRQAPSQSPREVAPIPAGYHTLTPFFVAPDVDAMIVFVERAFDASVEHRMRSADGITRHAAVRIGSSMLMISSGTELYAPRPSTLHVYVEDVDAVYAAARAAGAQRLEEPADQFYGDRRAGVRDAWNNHWWIATHIEDVSAPELRKREEQFRRQHGMA
jgi:uncharacterized glyoxalase superfamily protein PhnB